MEAIFFGSTSNLSWAELVKIHWLKMILTVRETADSNIFEILNDKIVYS